MKRSVNDLIGFSIGATDGEIGNVKDFYFDDETWTVRYFIVETGNWFSGRKMLIAPEAVLTPDWEQKVLLVNLTKEQVKSSPDIDTEKPVSRQEEIKLYKHYPWTAYWGGGILSGGIGAPGMMVGSTLPLAEGIQKEEDDTKNNPHLRSCKQVKGYKIEASDGKVGDVEDFILNDNTWEIDFIIVDTGNWFHGKKVLISPAWIDEINWGSSSVRIKVSVDTVKNSPEYDEDMPISEAYHDALHHYYKNAR